MSIANEIGAKLTAKVGPLPVWAYGGIGAVGIFLLSRGGGGAKGGDSYLPLPDGNKGERPEPTDAIGSFVSGWSGASYYGPGTDPNGVIEGVFTPINDANDGERTVAVDTSKPAGATATGGFGKTFFEGIGWLFKTGNYYTGIDPVIDTAYPVGKTGKDGFSILPVEFSKPNPDAVPKYDPETGGFTIPGTDKTQGITPDDLVRISQQRIASDPSLQQKLAQSSVTEDQRKYAVVGPGGIIQFYNPEPIETGATSGPTNTDTRDNVPDTYAGIALTPGVADYLSQYGI